MRLSIDSGLRILGHVIVAAFLAAVIAGHPAANAEGASAWQSLPTLPAPTAGLTAVRMPDDSIVALGGDATLGQRSRMAIRLDPRHDAWRRLPSAPVDLDTPGALVLGDHAVFVVAPSFANGAISAPSQVLILDPVWGRWLSLPPCPVALLKPRVLRLTPNTVLAAGGVGNLLGATFNLTTLRWTPFDSPVPNLAGYTLADLPGKGAVLLASVAIDARGNPIPVRRAWLLGPSSSWTQIARPPVLMDGASAMALGSTRILFAGGYPLGDDPRLPAPPALLYDLALNQWTIAGSTGSDHRGGQLVALGNGAAVLVGGHAPTGQPTSSCLMFSQSSWRHAFALPAPWAGYAAVSTDRGELLLIGGARPSTTGPIAGAAAVLLPFARLSGAA
ncbi:MAG TPA: kelch repeat-containing protein [Chloroflexota bacterium]|nr:kelch repeat-containing protein [Chloroflexota bacterium]